MKLAARRLTRRLVESVKPSQQKFLSKINGLSVLATISRNEVYTSLRLMREYHISKQKSIQI